MKHLVKCFLGLQVLLLSHLAATATPAVAAPRTHKHQLYSKGLLCNSDEQIVRCGQIAMAAAAERRACCRMFRPDRVPASAAAAINTALQSRPALPPRTDLDLTNGIYAFPIDWQHSSNCTSTVQVDFPVFLPNGEVQIMQQTVRQLNSSTIKKIKAAAMANASSIYSSQYSSLYSVDRRSGFAHPGNCIGTGELAMMQHRVTQGIQPQLSAKDILLSGAGIPPKFYDGGWFPPTHTPLNYSGPYAMQVVDIKWSGINTARVRCPANYPLEAPKQLCAHISLVELDSEQSHKQAMAYMATGDQRYLTNALEVIDAWATINKEWGYIAENGPLEAGWACATMAKSLELLRHEPAAAPVIARFSTWVDAVLMPQMDHYAEVNTEVNLKLGTKHLFGNWHSTIAECFMAYGVLTDNRARYDKGVALYHTTVDDYFKWGKGTFSNGRILGECSETLRDIYHSQFGFGGLIQAAEIAWQQDDDLYSSSGYALVAALELHARIIRAWQTKDKTLLPTGFRYGEDMPQAPEGTMWKFDIRQQMWQAINLTTYQPVANLTDGYKYLIGIMFLPTGWEMAYNHYVGRLGMQLPETAALLAINWPEWQSFHWGLGSLSHATTAAELWRPGVTAPNLCQSATEATPSN